MKKQATISSAVLIYLIYNLIIYTTWYLGDANYTTMMLAENALKNITAPLLIGAVFMVGVLSYFGWWQPVMKDDQPAKAAWVMWPVLLVSSAMIVVQIYTTNWANIEMSHFVALAVASVLVGFNEEALTRGVLLLGFKTKFSSEAAIWFWTTLLFGLLHLPNGFFGLGLVQASIQVVFTFLMGSGLYVLRRGSGGLLLPIIIHGLWDFGSFANGASGAESVVYKPALQMACYAVAFIMVIILVIANRKKSAAIA